MVTRLTDTPIGETEYLDTDFQTGRAVTGWYLVRAVDVLEQLSEASDEAEMWVVPLGKQLAQGGPTAIPASYQMDEAYPNPFNPVTNIDYALPVNSNVDLRIYNMPGGQGYQRRVHYSTSRRGYSRARRLCRRHELLPNPKGASDEMTRFPWKLP